MILFPHGFKTRSIRIPCLLLIDKWLLVRRIKFWVQKITRGFSDDEMWSLDMVCAKWLLPRLREFMNCDYSFWDKAERSKKRRKDLEDIEWWLEGIVNNKKIYTEFEDLKREKRARKVFGKIFPTLWY